MLTVAVDRPAPQQDAVARVRWWRVAAAFVAGRVAVVVGAALVGLPTALSPHLGRARVAAWAERSSQVFTSWDGQWYLRVVRDGYPRSVRPEVTFEVADARAAFFPTYPSLVRAADWVSPGGDTVPALLLNLVLGAVAVWLVGLIARDLYGPQVAERAMVLVALFPGSFVLSFAYTEALLITVAAASMLFLMRRQWVWAGVFAAVGTATRPNGVALVAACAVASIVAIRERRKWRSLIAPALAPVGFIGFQLWLGRHAGEFAVWFRVQTEAWGEGVSWGWTAVSHVWLAVTSGSLTGMITAMSVACLAAGGWWAWRARIPAPLAVYTAVVAALMMIPETVTARPRFVHTAFPLFIAAAVWFERRRPGWWSAAVAVCAVGLTALTAIYGAHAAIP